MKKKWMIIISICAVLVLGAVAAIVCWFACPGVRFSGNLANFNLKEADCYIISGDKVIGRTTMTLNGIWNSADESGGSSCRFAIGGYTDIVSGNLVEKFSATKIQDRWTAQYYAFDDWDGSLSCSEEEDQTAIIVQMDFVENTPVVRIDYGEAYKKDTVWAVCADSEDEALELFKKFKEQ